MDAGLGVLPTVLVNQKFPDISMMADAIDWDLDFRQLGAGQLDADVLAVAGDRSVVLRVDFNRKFHQLGCPPPEVVTFGYCDTHRAPIRWNNRASPPGVLLNFNEGRFDGVSEAGFRGYTFSFLRDEVHQVASVLGIELDDALNLRAHSFWVPQDTEHQMLGGHLRVLEHAAASGDRALLKDVAEIVNFELAASMVRIVGRAELQRHAKRESAPFRAAALKRALARIDDGEQIPASVSKLCREAGSSLATLERAFADEFGVSPKSYMQSKRLASVRRALIRAEPGVLIADVANRWDFWHMGRFAAEYRKQFGELPSQTVRGSTSPISRLRPD